MLTTCNEDLAKRLRLLANHGMSPRYYHIEVGINSRLDSIQAAVLLAKFASLETWITGRAENAARYRQLFAATDLGDSIELPTEDLRGKHVWNQFTIRVKNGLRDEVRKQLTEAHVGTEIYYPVPLHRQACFSTLDIDPDSLPETEAASAEVLSLPIYPELSVAQQERVVQTLADIIRGLRGKKQRAA
jgi:dTDP-4-amino-4,6-dideoxygalactose transaminase